MSDKCLAKTMEDHLLRRIFRSILLVTVFDMVGWASTQSTVTVLAFVDLPGEVYYIKLCTIAQITGCSNNTLLLKSAL